MNCDKCGRSFQDDAILSLPAISNTLVMDDYFPLVPVSCLKIIPALTGDGDVFRTGQC